MTDYSAIINDIHNASEHKNLTFFVGAGVSHCSGTKGWGELISEIDFKLNGKARKNISSDEYLGIAEAFYHHSNKDYDAFLRENFENPSVEPNQIHDLFFKFCPANFITTNFEDLLEKAAVKNCKTFISVSKEDEIAFVNGEHFIIKAHGDYKSGNIVFKDSDYLNYSSEHKLIDTLIKSIFASNLVIFIGYSLQDYTIRYILNWVHNCLKEKFKPIFIYTDDRKLLKSDIEYQSSRGLRIVDWHNYLKRSERKVDFTERYVRVLNSFLTDGDRKFSKTNDKENFNLLYEKLLPLDSFFALRHEDIIRILKYNIDIDTSGKIFSIPSQPNILKLCMDYTVQKEKNRRIPKDDLKKYKTILNVFKKAGVFYTIHNGSQIKFDSDFIADKNIILFDYKKMEAFVNKSYSVLIKNYKKAYYLFSLARYEESYRLYQTVIYESFKTKNYVIYYLAQKNIYNLHEMKMSNPVLYNFIESTNLPKHEEDIFSELPNDFKMTYSMFSNMYTLNNLYKNTYKANTIADKMENINSTNSVEIGETSFWKGNSFVFNSLHFGLGNYLLTDEFSEFKASIKVIMEQQLFQYAEVGKKSLSETPFHNYKNYPIFFSEIDIFCFIKYFSQKELEDVFYKYGIIELKIAHDTLINKAIINLFSFYADTISPTNKYSLMHKYCKKLAACLELLCHIVISKNTVECILSILFKCTFYEMPFTLRWRFINFQDKNKSVNLKARNILLSFIIKGIKERKEISKTKSVVNNTHDLDYTEFSKFLKKDDNPSISELDSVVHEILVDYPNYPIKELLYYYNLVNTENKTRIRLLATEKLKNDFDIAILIDLISVGEKLTTDEIKLVHQYLVKNILKNKSHCLEKKQEGILAEIGFLCFKGELPQKDFLVYLGYYDLFDFLVSPETFEQNKFDIHWISDSFLHVHEFLSRNQITKSIINQSLSCFLKANKCTYADKKRFTDIYFKYYV